MNGMEPGMRQFPTAKSKSQPGAALRYSVNSLGEGKCESFPKRGSGWMPQYPLQLATILTKLLMLRVTV
jgi:hypothetical protein